MQWAALPRDADVCAKYQEVSRAERVPGTVEPDDLVVLECIATVTARCHPLAIVRIIGHDVDWAGLLFSMDSTALRSGGCGKLRCRELS
jgi:hypothetical protein